MNQIQLPVGFRDSILEECRKKNQLKMILKTVFDAYGYEEIVTPVIEYYQTYSKAFTNLNDQEMYKFFDQEQDILTLRMDMTVPIARAVTTRFKDANGPFRLQYCANVYKVRPTFGGRYAEVSDCGIELIGLDQEADLEVLACAFDALNALSIPSYVLEIGTVEFFDTACRLLNLNTEQRAILADLIDRKSLVELKEYLLTLDLPLEIRHFFLKLPLLGGDGAVLEEAKRFCFDPRLMKVVDQLIELNQGLAALGYGDKVRYDFGKIPHLNYYTGLIFEGFVEGIGTSVLSGGRYDTLLKVFGNDLPACGFSFKLDELAETYMKVDPIMKSIVYYPMNQKIEAMKLAQQLRRERIVELRPSNREEIVIEEVWI